MSTKAVIGLGFGDEGKGKTVDCLCSRDPSAMVVRFNGGHQAGHTVVANGVHHVFSNFGSGTLRGCPTYWSRHCTFEPTGMLNELEDLKKKGFNPQLFVDAECPVTTHFDILMNRRMEEIKDHGSCGVGFGVTIEREERFFSLKFIDLFYPDILISKLKAIKGYHESGLPSGEFLDTCAEIRECKNIHMVFDRPEAESYIYEGAQGLLLDQHYGFFPNVTRSNCGTENLPDEEIDYYLVTRAYQTRHGNGPMANENISHGIVSDPNETNQTHMWQGEFRRSILSLDFLKYAIDRDRRLPGWNSNLVVTCLDHLKEYTYTYGDLQVWKGTKESFLDGISSHLGIIKVFYSESNDSEFQMGGVWQDV